MTPSMQVLNIFSNTSTQTQGRAKVRNLGFRKNKEYFDYSRHRWVIEGIRRIQVQLFSPRKTIYHSSMVRFYCKPSARHFKIILPTMPAFPERSWFPPEAFYKGKEGYLNRSRSCPQLTRDHR